MAVPSLIPSLPKTQALSSKSFRPPPLDGSLSIPQIYDWHYDNNPNHPLFIYSLDDGSIRNISWAETVRAGLTGARLIRERVAERRRRSTDAPVVAILSLADSITYFTTLLSVMRADCVVFPISPRNSALAVAHLLNATSVNHIIVGREPAMQALAREAMDILKRDYPSFITPDLSVIPAFEDLFLLDSESPEPKDIPLERADPGALALYFHSSGSTALPRPVPFSNRRFMELSLTPYFGERDLTGAVMGLQVLPMFHGMGAANMCWAASCGYILATFQPKFPSVPPTPDTLFESAKITQTDFIFCVPTFVEAWSQQPERVKWLATRKGIIYGGGPLGKEAGDRMISQGAAVFINYGITEAGMLSTYLPADPPQRGEDCDYFKITQSVNFEMVPFDGHSFELVILPSEYSHPSSTNTTINGVEALATSDLVTPHPTKPGYWRVFGRKDDQIMHSTGEKTNPVPLESMLNQDPHIAASVMFGRGRFQAGVIVEPKPAYKFDPTDEEKLSEFRNMIWPTVEKLNLFAPQHSRIFKEMILVSVPSRPFTFTGKNTPRRQAILKEYDNEISFLYDLVEKSAQVDVPEPQQWDLVTTKDFVRSLVVKVLGRAVQDDDDLFQHGCDSLQATWIRNSLHQILRKTAELDTRQSTRNFIYDYPTIEQLSRFVFASISGRSLLGPLNSTLEVEKMRALADKYSKDYPHPQSTQRTSPERAVLLTGSTGALGTYVLGTLLRDPMTAHIYALNRKGDQDLKGRQMKAFLERGLGAQVQDLESGKVTLIEGDTADQNFGLPASVYQKMMESVTHIIHTAWRVDFNLGLPSFESNIKGLRNIVDFAVLTNSRVLFISSIGIFSNCQNVSRELFPLKEDSVEPTISLGAGYSQGKWVSEEILFRASYQTGLSFVNIRLGQLSGGVNGAWNTKEWLPSMVQTSTFLGCLPDDSRTVSWIPVDIAARAVVDYLSMSDGIHTVHLVHPRPCTWSSLAVRISSELGVELVPYSKWLEALEKAAASHHGESLTREPSGLRLLPFYKSIVLKEDSTKWEAFGGARLDMANAIASSPTLSSPNLQQVDSEDVAKWLGYWRTAGLLG